MSSRPAQPQGAGFIYLASQSPRRRQLLAQIGVRYELLLPRQDEDAEALEAERVHELPAEYAMRVTLAKLNAACDRLRRAKANDADRAGKSPFAEAPILCCDTTVALGRRILGKPRDAEDAARTLRMLSGKTHRVITAVAVAAKPLGPRRGAVHTAVSTSRVQFATLTSDAIAEYVQSGEPFGKAGAYAIQSAISACIVRIEGSYSGIMGLPLFETAQLLRRCGITVSMDPDHE